MSGPNCGPSYDILGCPGDLAEAAGGLALAFLVIIVGVGLVFLGWMMIRGRIDSGKGGGGFE